ncbi:MULTISPECIES: sigma-70 family RNA polymerase sigma factor [Streptomyces]|uniref:Sigma-70 family RNA polymerase sigma factor n=1 Tax=Streptomyces olivaceiscleroticus TaxID=68245 RepID=A0ABP3K9A9_9ACTN|nr:sigma-70 family RNA polymerase sigma factor [Streptomyces niger]
MTDRDRELITALRPLLTAEAAAEAPAAGADAEDIEQDVWARLLRYTRTAGPPADPARWLRRAVRAEARGALRRSRREIPYDPTGAQPRVDAVAEPLVLDAERRRALLAVAGQLPGRCPALLRALLSGTDPTYREISSELGMSQGSMGPLRSRCLGCLRRMLTAEVGVPELRGKER